MVHLTWAVGLIKWLFVDHATQPMESDAPVFNKNASESKFSKMTMWLSCQVSKTATQEEAEKLKERDSKKSGIDAVLASLQAAKKVNVLDKSRDDWGQFKKTDAEIEQELDAYKKSGGKYLDKVDFLKRTELREYEAERDQRLAGDIRSRGRM